MAEYLDIVPNTPNNVADSWQPLVARQGAIQLGFNGLSLTNWDGGTSKPEIADGSLIEVAGGVVKFTADEAIQDEAGLSDGTVYVYIDVQTATPFPFFSNTAPSWDAAKNGFYDTSGNRATGHVMTRGSSGASFSSKREFFDKEGGLQFTKSSDGNLSIDGNALANKFDAGSGMVLSKNNSYTFVTVAPGGILSLGTGLYMIQPQSRGSGAGEMQLEVFDGSSWGGTGLTDPYSGGLFWADSNATVRLREISFTASVNIRYRKII